MLLHDLGESVDPRVLQTFAGADGAYVSFPYERHSSVGVNVHVLHTLGLSTVTVTVDENNSAAMALYLSRDFRRLTDDDAEYDYD